MTTYTHGTPPHPDRHRPAHRPPRRDRGHVDGADPARRRAEIRALVSGVA